MKIWTPNEFKTVNWKNGGGLTEELLVYPEVDPFKWRMSVATIQSSGPFSFFRGYRRILVLLSGEIAITHSHKSEVILQPMNPYLFEGDMKTDCRLLSESSRDFNFIFNPDFVDCKLSCTVVKAGDKVRLKEGPCFVYVSEGRVRIHDSTCLETTYVLERHHLCQFEEQQLAIDLEPCGEGPAQLITLEIHHKNIDSTRF